MKKMWVSVLLTVLFSPLGLFYVLSIKDALIATAISVVLAALTGGFSLLITYPLFIIWAVKETRKINSEQE